MRIFEVPEGSKTSKGRAIQNLINIEQDDKIKAYVVVKDIKDQEYLKRPATQEDIDNGFAENLEDLVDRYYIVMCTKKGVVKKTSLESYSRPRTNGINAISIREGDELLEARLTNGSNEILMAIKSGRAIRFNETKVRPMGRTASGVRGITLTQDKDEVIGMVCVEDYSKTILVVSEFGYGKRTYLNDPETDEAIYRITNRGGKGVKTLNVTDKTGNLVAMKVVTDEDDLMIINKSGIAIRMHVADLRTQGRATQGVKLINLKGKDQIAAVAKVESDDEDEGSIDGADENGKEIDTDNVE
jgi:DNA gyrase subunit A